MAKNDFKDTEYIAVIDGDRTLLLFKEEDLKGKSKLDIQEEIGEKLGPGRYAMNHKLKTESAIRTTRIRGITKEVQKDKVNVNVTEPPLYQSKQLNKLIETIEGLKNTKSDIGIDYLLDVTKQSYQMQVEILKANNSALQDTIKNLEQKIKDLERELDKVEDANSSNILLSTLQGILKPKAHVPATSLKDNVNEKNIPKDFIKVLAQVDYNKVPEKDLNNYLGIFQKFVNQLPQKETTA